MTIHRHLLETGKLEHLTLKGSPVLTLSASSLGAHIFLLQPGFKSHHCLLALYCSPYYQAYPTGSGSTHVTHIDESLGFWCVNDEQPDGTQCADFAVRFCCPQVKIRDHLKT